MLIMVDPGHGGNDSGAVSPSTGTEEKHVTLEYANNLLLYLDADIGYTSQMTRYRDVDVSLDDRCSIANSACADVFVSIHCNSCEQPNTGHGFEIFHHPDSPTGKALANYIHDQWKEAHGIEYTRGVKTANYRVLRKTTMPAVLVELGFINNDADLHNMLNIFWMARAVSGIVGGIWYFENS